MFWVVLSNGFWGMRDMDECIESSQKYEADCTAKIAAARTECNALPQRVVHVIEIFGVAFIANVEAT